MSGDTFANTQTLSSSSISSDKDDSRKYDEIDQFDQTNINPGLKNNGISSNSNSSANSGPSSSLLLPPNQKRNEPWVSIFTHPKISSRFNFKTVTLSTSNAKTHTKGNSLSTPQHTKSKHIVSSRNLIIFASTLIIIIGAIFHQLLNIGSGPNNYSPLKFISNSFQTTNKHLKTTSPLDESNYVVIIDAGSTGSRVHVYEFNNSALGQQKSPNSYTSTINSIPIPQLIHETFELTRPGLSYKDYVLDFEQGAQSLDPLLRTALQVVPRHLQPFTPLSVKATAGLRLIGDETSSKYMAYIKEHLINNYPFNIRDVGIMAGKEEGVFAWLTTNYLLGNLDRQEDQAGQEQQVHNKNKTSQPQKNLKNTAAVFDLGGASTQIVFEPNPEVYPDNVLAKLVHAGYGDHIYDLVLGDYHYRLYQNSYLGYGLMEARKKIHRTLFARYLEVALKNKNEGSDSVKKFILSKDKLTKLQNPCISTGMKRTVEIPIREVLNEQLFSDEEEFKNIDYYIEELTSMGLIKPNTLNKKDIYDQEMLFVTMVGPDTPESPEGCLDIALQIFNLDAECSFHPCSFNGVHQPSISSNFGGKGLKLPNEDNEDNKDDETFLNKGQVEMIKDAISGHKEKEINTKDTTTYNTDTNKSDDAPLYIFSYFYDRTYPLGLPSKFPISEFLSLLSDICQGPRSWDPSHPQYSPPDRFTQLSQHVIEELNGRPEWCLDLGVMYTMLHNGYKIPLDKQVTIAKQVNGHELGWCLGAAIAILGDLEEQPEQD